MILKSNNITHNDIKNYWFKLFNEYESMEKLETSLKDISDIDIKNIEEFIEGYDDSLNISVEEVLSLEESPILNKLDKELEKHLPFYYFHKPIINFYIEDFYSKLNNFYIIDDKEVFLKKAVDIVVEGLFEFSRRTLILEVNIARMRQDLKGDTSEDRYNYFVYTLLNDKEYLSSLYNEYLHLFDLIINRAKQSFNFIIEIIESTNRNIERIKKEILDTNEELKITTIESSLGDSHNNGKTVCMINFSNEKKVVFKPRVLGLEEGFNKFLNFINDKNLDNNKDLYTLKIVNDKNCGFTEFIEYNECLNEEEVKDFYFRVGKLLAILYSLNAKDMHHENIISMGKHPVLIDLEALFHSSVVLMEKEYFCSHEVAYEIIDTSVYSIGFLPQKISNNSDDGTELTVDVSGLGAVEDQVSPFKFLQVKNHHTDELKLEEDFGIITVQNNNPKVNGDIRKSENYIDYIKEGFVLVYNFIKENKDEVTEVIYEIFKGKKNRFILRPTYLYGQLIKTSYHPDFCREKIHREILLNRLGINIDKKFKHIVSSEVSDILGGDVPYFYAYVDSNRINNSKDLDINLELDKSPMEKVLLKVKNFSLKDLNRQLNFIDMSFLAKTTNSNKDLTPIVFSEDTKENEIKKDELLDLATKIGDYIIERSIIGEGKNGIDRTWISTTLEGRDEGTWSLNPVGDNLYDGNSGIALFLGYLGYLTKEDRFINASIEAMDSAMNTVEKLDGSIPYLTGSYNGLTGYFYTLSKLYKITGNTKLLDAIKNNISILYKLIDGDKSIDVIGGAAGAIGALITIYEDIDDSKLKETVLDLAVLNYKHLKDNAIEFFNDSVAWGKGKVYAPSTGFAHGNAGIAAYLGKLFYITKDPEIKDLIDKTLNYERHLYVESEKNWKSSHDKERMARAWCHGAPGILLGRTILKDIGYEDNLLDFEIESAIDTTIKKGFGNNPCYCHGDIGNLAILEYTAKVLGNKEMQNRCENTFIDVFNNLIKKRWNKGVYCGTEAMGLMIGLAGFGYALINKYNEDLVPPVLWFR